MAQQSPVSQPVVTKGSTQSASPTSGQQRESTGPEAKVNKTPFEFNDLRFPENVGTVGKLRHWIKFTPTVQQKSSYEVKKTGSESTTDSNRAAIKGQLGSSSDPFDRLTSIGTGAAALGVIQGATSALEKLSSSSVLEQAKAPISFGGGAARGALIGGFAGGIVSAINLTRKTRRAAGSIALYMPDTVNQINVNDYDQVSLTAELGLAGLAAQAGTGLTEGAMADILKGYGQTLGSAARGEVAGALAGKTGLFGQGITDVLLFSAGYAQNPQVELLFKTIQNREFIFDFKFVPRNKKEAETIIKIIQSFRFFAAPEIPTTGNGRYFIPPSEFDIEFMVRDQPNKNLPKLSTCVLQGIDVNYGSAGQWTAFEDGMPVEILMQLRFKEVEIMHKELIRQGF